MIREAGEAKTEGKVWEIVRKERKGRKRVNEEIEMEEWKEHFMGLLGGVEGRVVRGGRERRDEREETELEQGEVRGVIGKLKGGRRQEKTGFQMRRGSTEERNWRNGYGRYVRGYGVERDGQKNGKRVS